ncbi:hypothetical protein JCM19029_08650 [Salinicoccus sesuvii]|uniref:hypothetical protein n=1 Tax=Salinicoccus sesuvii TaxID=868281 RepID=UPI003611277A
MDYERADNENYGIYLIATRFDDIDFSYLREKLKSTDIKALHALEQWIKVAQEN